MIGVNLAARYLEPLFLSSTLGPLLSFALSRLFCLQSSTKWRMECLTRRFPRRYFPLRNFTVWQS